MEEEAAFKAFAAQPNLHEQIFSKVAPNIFGHADIKKAVACLLFGGARKVSPPLLPSYLHIVAVSGAALDQSPLLHAHAEWSLFPAAYPRPWRLPVAACTKHAQDLIDG